MNKAQALKLVEITSQCQANNGTVCYFDPIVGCSYMSYESGYVRRSYTTRNWRGERITTTYQLNKTRLVPYNHNSDFCRTERILEMDPQARLDIICRAAVNYRKSVIKKYANA